MIYRSITQLQKKAGGVTRVCQVLAVSRSGYYAARRRPDRGAKVCPVSVRLQAVFARSGRTYGSRRLQAELRGEGIKLGRYRVRRLMHTHGLRATWRRKFIHTTDSRHGLPTASNVLDRQFEPEAPNLAWVSDITYLRTRSGWLYLAVVTTRDVTEYIVGFYNSVRLHSKLGYLSPTAYERNMAEKHLIGVSESI